MKHLAISLAVLVLTFSPTKKVDASEQRTDQLLWECTGKTPENLPEMGILACGKYLDGIIDMHSIAVGFRKMPPLFCTPKTGISMDQGIRIFIQWANQNPQELHKGARVSVIKSLIAAFPCE